MNNIQALEDLKNNGHRLTPARKAIIEEIYKSKTPVSARDLLKILSNHGLHLNKTTIYRELEFLLANKIIHVVNFGEESKRYEFNRQNHHHHLICTNCKSITEIDIDLKKFEKNLLKIQDHIGQGKKFKVDSHHLEFFGLCKSCN